MSREIATLGGAIATMATSVVAGVTIGQVDGLNQAVIESAKFTASNAEQTVVRHVVETVGKATATAGVAVAAGVTLGCVDSLNDTVVMLGKSNGDSAVDSGMALVRSVGEMADGTPVVGNIKGGIHYAVGDITGGAKAMKPASRTTGVVVGGFAGIPAGPGGIVMGCLAGGAAMDGIITGASSAIEGRFVPYGQIASWNAVAKQNNANEIVGGVVGGLIAPVMNGGLAGSVSDGVVVVAVAEIFMAESLALKEHISSLLAEMEVAILQYGCEEAQ
jgi:hypothetical protein